MTAFPGFNPQGECPLCRTNANKPTLLIPIFGKELIDNSLQEVQQVHVECVHRLVGIYIIEFKP